MQITVVIPLYNKEKYILSAIESVLNQTHPDFELLVVDDGSTDGSANVVKSIHDSRIRLVSQPNGGVSKARNEGVRLANSEWVAFLDADDEYEPCFLKHVVSFLRGHEKDGLSLVGANYYIGTRFRKSVDNVFKDGVYDYFQLFGNQKSPNHSSTTIVNKQEFLKVGGFPEGVRQFEDWIAWVKLAFVGNFGYIATPLGIYHHVEGSVSKSKRLMSEFYADAVLLPQTIYEYASTYPLPPERIRNALGCASEFSVNIASILAHGSEKRLAFKILKYVRPRYLLCGRAGKFKLLLMHLVVPQCLRRVYRKMRR